MCYGKHLKGVAGLGISKVSPDPNSRRHGKSPGREGCGPRVGKPTLIRWASNDADNVPNAATRAAAASGAGPPPAKPQRVQAAAFTSIFFCGFCAAAVFGKVIVSTPFERSAAILSRSTPSGNTKARWNEP